MKLSDLKKIEVGDWVRTNKNGTWKKVTKKFTFGLELQEKEGYSKSSIDICYVKEHKKS